MKPIIFVRVAHMDYYKGVDKDTPVYGGKYVQENKEGHEAFNFCPYGEFDSDKKVCLGFSQIKGYRIGRQTLHIENIFGCMGMTKEDYVDGVIVVFFAKADEKSNQRVVGFYRNARVYRRYQTALMSDDFLQDFLFKADAKDCVLLPLFERRRKETNGYNTWWIPQIKTKSKQISIMDKIGTGQSMFWFGGGTHSEKQNDEVRAAEMAFVERMIKSIENYKGENWLYRSNEESEIDWRNLDIEEYIADEEA